MPQVGTIVLIKLLQMQVSYLINRISLIKKLIQRDLASTNPSIFPGNKNGHMRKRDDDYKKKSFLEFCFFFLNILKDFRESKKVGFFSNYRHFRKPL